MLADSAKIEWLLENRTQYFIAKNSKIPQSTLSNLKTGKKKLSNISFENAYKLTELAQAEMDKPEA